MYRFFLTLAIMLLLSVQCFSAEADIRKVLIRDVTTVEGVRENPLLGYGMVVGLNGTGDRRQTAFSTQTLANILQRMGVQIPAGSARVNNVAAVFVTASLPAFARPGMNLDVTVSSVGDAKSGRRSPAADTPAWSGWPDLRGGTGPGGRRRLQRCCGRQLASTEPSDRGTHSRWGSGGTRYGSGLG